MKDFGFVIIIVLPQRRSPGILGKRLGENGIVLRSKYFLPSVGQFTKVYCNHEGKKIVEKYMGRQMVWQIQSPNIVPSLPTFPHESNMA